MAARIGRPQERELRMREELERIARSRSASHGWFGGRVLTVQQPASEQPKTTAEKPPAAAKGSAVEAKARLIADITKDFVSPL